jgi:hypothetical protein
VRRPVWSTLAAVGVIAVCTSVASAETMQSALVKAYQNNPQLNAQRANARSIDENAGDLRPAELERFLRRASGYT